MVTDGNKAYPDIINKFEMIQLCVFHMNNVGQEVYPVIRRINRKNKSKNQKIMEINKKLKKTLEEYEPQKGPIADKKQKNYIIISSKI